MAKQLLIYDRVIPVSPQRHGNKSIKAGANFSYANGVNSVPLMAAEFDAASQEYTVVFAGEAGAMMPVALLGLRDGENVFVDEQGAWTGKYVPAFVRQYPFVFASSDRGDTFTLCVDTAFAGLNDDGVGERLFDSAGERTQFLQNVLGFLQAYQVQYRLTRRFVQKLEDLNLLDAMEAQAMVEGGQRVKLSGFRVVNRERLRAVAGDKLAEFARSGELDLIYAHLHSLRNVNALAQRFRTKPPGSADRKGRAPASRVPAVEEA